MSKAHIIQSIATEYGVAWAVNRGLYGAKLKLLRSVPQAEKWFEARTDAVRRTDIFSVDNRAVSAFLKNLPKQEKEQLIQTADQAAKGIIKGFSSVNMDYGNPIRWQKNPFTQQECDAGSKWYWISDFDAVRGDIKAIWEASRFSHFIAFARAYLLTGDEKYYKAYRSQLASWLGGNPYGYGANYKCGQECAIRMINALLAHTVFANAGLSDEEDNANVARLVSGSYQKILSNFFYARRCIKNNHTISELVGMVIGAWCCGDSRRTGKAYKMLDKVILEQFTADGGYTQFSFNYQRLALQDLECILSISGKTGRRLGREAMERIQKSAMLLYQVQDEITGDVPNYGANDGALILPVTSCGYRDFRPVIGAITALTGGYRIYGAGAWDEELLWFAGGIEKYRYIEVQRTSMQFPEAGLFSLRNGKSHLMLVLNRYKSRPAHMDQLHLDLWRNGVNVLCDCGTYSYADHRGAALAATQGHNTVQVGEKQQMNKHGPFLVCNWTKRAGVKFEKDCFAGSMKSANGYVHQREIRASGHGYVLTDRVLNCQGEWAVRFHTPCEVEERADGATLVHEGKRICSITGCKCRVEPAVRSLYYLKTEPCSCISFFSNGENKLQLTIQMY